MNTLIEIKEQIVDQETVQTVNARDLHVFLEIGKDFSTWIKDRIHQYKFEEGSDFIKTQDLRSPKLGSAKSRAVTAIDYHLTLDMAKELSMVERNEKGRQARRYFIECEKKLKSQSIDYDNDTRFDLPSYWEGMSAGEKALYLLGPIHVRLIDAFRVDEENRKYKALIKEAKRVLATSVTKAAFLKPISSPRFKSGEGISHYIGKFSLSKNNRCLFLALSRSLLNEITSI